MERRQQQQQFNIPTMCNYASQKSRMYRAKLAYATPQQPANIFVLCDHAQVVMQKKNKHSNAALEARGGGEAGDSTRQKVAGRDQGVCIR